MQHSLKLTVQSDKKQRQHNESKPQQQQKEEKQMTLHKFTLRPDNNEYFLGISRIPQQNPEHNLFRVAIIDKTDCWITEDKTFEHYKNKSLISGQDTKQFRNHLIHALTRPNDDRYEIEEIYFDKEQEKHHKEIKIYHMAGGLRIQMAKFKFYAGRNNLFYCFGKLASTLRQKIRENVQFNSDNVNFQKQYNETLELVNEAISAKSQQEEELLNKFVFVLNEKKKQIRSLQSEIVQLKGNRNNNKNRNRKRKSDVLDDCDSESEEIVVPKCKKRKIAKQSRNSDSDSC